MSDQPSSTNSEIAAAKAQTESFRERLAARRQKRSQLIAAVTNSTVPLKVPSASNIAAILTAKNPPEQSKSPILSTKPQRSSEKQGTLKQTDEGET